MADDPQISRVSAVGGWLRRGAENIMVALLSVMFATFIVQIFARYVLNNPLGWTEEVIITAWLWIVLWGAAFVLSEREEIRFDIVYSGLPAGVRRICTIITGVALMVLYAASLPASYAYVSFMKVERSASLHVPLNWLYAIYVIFVVACIGRYLWLVLAAIRGSQDADAAGQID